MATTQIKKMTTMAMLMGIMIIMGFTPLGSIPLPFMKATTTHIPVIMAAILYGWKAGAIFGLGFGVVSIIRSTLMPNLTSFAFSPFVPLPGSDSGSWKALLIAFIPRVCIGLFVAACYKLLSGHTSKKVCYAVCGVVGSITNTALVLGMIYLLLGREYAIAQGIGFDALLGLLCGVVFSNGIGEAIVAAVLTPALLSTADYISARAVHHRT